MRKIKRMDIVTKYGTYGDRELSQLIRRNMITREHKDKTKYTRKLKHKNRHGTSN